MQGMKMVLILSMMPQQMEHFQEKDLTMNTLLIFQLINTHNQQLTLTMMRRKMNQWTITLNRNFLPLMKCKSIWFNFGDMKSHYLISFLEDSIQIMMVNHTSMIH